MKRLLSSADSMNMTVEEMKETARVAGYNQIHANNPWKAGEERMRKKKEMEDEKKKAMEKKKEAEKEKKKKILESKMNGEKEEEEKHDSCERRVTVSQVDDVYQLMGERNRERFKQLNAGTTRKHFSKYLGVMSLVKAATGTVSQGKIDMKILFFSMFVSEVNLNL